MKMKCPVCNKEIYTNPFATNKTIECDFCKHKLYRNEVANRILSRIFSMDMAFSIGGMAALHFLYRSPRLDLVILLIVVSEWMFELPQRTLMKRGILKYSDKPVNDLPSDVE